MLWQRRVLVLSPYLVLDLDLCPCPCPCLCRPYRENGFYHVLDGEENLDFEVQIMLNAANIREKTTPTSPVLRHP
jgi:hypothetical protein